MITPLDALIAIIAITLAIDLFLVFRPAATHGSGGRLLAFLGIFLMPLLITGMAFDTHMETSKQTEYCLSCHTMLTHGLSLYVDDKEYIPAVHFQNHRVPKEKACFTCHTQYTLYGDYAAKMRGLRHIYYQYIGTIPDTIKLHEPYNNRECLHCHEGARSFEEQSIHTGSPGQMDSIKRNEISCLSSGCHDIAHDAMKLDRVQLWEPYDARYRPAWFLDTLARSLAHIQPSHIVRSPAENSTPAASPDATSNTESN